MAVAWFFVATAPCSTLWDALSACLLTLNVCVVLWANHVAIGKLSSWRTFWTWLTRCLFDLLVCSLAFIGLTAVSPHYDCMSPERLRASMMLLELAPYREVINAKFSSSRTLQGIGQGVSFNPTVHIHRTFISHDGAITAISEDPSISITLWPEIKGKEIEWKCSGTPKAKVPMFCREQE